MKYSICQFSVFPFPCPPSPDSALPKYLGKHLPATGHVRRLQAHVRVRQRRRWWQWCSLEALGARLTGAVHLRRIVLDSLVPFRTQRILLPAPPNGHAPRRSDVRATQARHRPTASPVVSRHAVWVLQVARHALLARHVLHVRRRMHGSVCENKQNGRRLTEESGGGEDKKTAGKTVPSRACCCGVLCRFCVLRIARRSALPPRNAGDGGCASGDFIRTHILSNDARVWTSLSYR